MKTHWRKLDDPNYLGAYSLQDGENRELTVTIEKVIVEEIRTEKGGERCKVAYLKDEKPVILNVTNCKIITKMFGTPYIDDWIGKKITLYVSVIKVNNEKMDCLRVRLIKSNILPKLTPKHEKWEGAKIALSEGSITIEDIKMNYKLTKKNEKLLCCSK